MTRNAESLILDFFGQRPDEELTVEFAADKWGFSERRLTVVLARMHAEGLVSRYRESTGPGRWQYVFMAAQPVAWGQA